MNEDELQQEREKATREAKESLDELERDFPGITEGAAAALGSTAGAAGSLAALYFLGTTGLSAAGITSGLAAAGAVVGGGMAAGIGVLAAPIALLAVGGFAYAKKRRNARLAAALGQAISKLYAILNRLQQNAEYFANDIAGLKATIDMLTRKKPS